MIFWWDSWLLPVAETELFFALLLIHSAVAVQVIEAPPLLPSLSDAWTLWTSVLLAILAQNGGHIFPAEACDVGHVLSPSSSCGLTTEIGLCCFLTITSDHMSSKHLDCLAVREHTGLCLGKLRVRPSYLHPPLLWDPLQSPPQWLHQTHQTFNQTVISHSLDSNNTTIGSRHMTSLCGW